MLSQSLINIEDENKVHVTLLGDSTIDNRIWVDGLISSYINTYIGVKRDEASVRVEQSHRILGKPELSVVENIMDMLPGHVIHDFTNDGFTTYDVLNGAYKDKVFGIGTFSLFSHEYFRPLQEGAKSIKKSQHIIVSIGGNDFREFLMNASRIQGQDRVSYINNRLNPVLERMRDQYVAILKKIRELNANAQIILMTQYYPSAIQNNYGIYPFMKEIGEALNIGGTFHDPMTVIHEIMKMTYSDVLTRIPDNNVVVADITSSLNLYANENHVSQIEPSGLGGNKIAQMLKYIMTSDKVVSGQAYRFYPEFFTTSEHDKHVQESGFADWQPAHPYDLREGYSFEEEKIYGKYQADQLSTDQMLELFEQSIMKHDISSPVYKAAQAVRQEAEDLSGALYDDDIKKWKMSIVLSMNILNTPANTPEYHDAIRLLHINAEHRAIGKADRWRQFIGALYMLAGAAIAVISIGLSLAGIPCTGGASIALGVTGGATGGFLFSLGALSFYNNSQQSLAAESSTLANEASSSRQLVI